MTAEASLECFATSTIQTANPANPTPGMFEELCRAGVGTFLVVASTVDFRELAGKYGANIVTIPHYPADNAGINIMFDRIMPDGDSIEIVETSNYVRHRRNRESL